MKQFSESPAAAQLSRAGSLGSHLESFVSTAADLGYSRSSVRAKLCLLGNFERWLKKKRLRVTDLQERLLEQFLDKRRRESRLAKGDPRTLQQFLDHLRENGVVQRPVPSIDVSPLGTIRARYEEYLRKQRGLSPLTIRDRWPFIQAFLDKRFGSGAIHLRDLTAADVSHFLLRQAHESTPQMLRRMVTALRSFFRFLCQRGEVATDLAGAIPMVRAYRLAGLPKYLKPAEVRRVLDACERTTAVGRRDRAVILLLARLGLRAGEVAGLELEDIDWRAGELTVHGKGDFHDRVPLPVDVGEALASYLHRDRPACSTRRVFVRLKAPNVGFRHSAAVSAIVKRAIARVDLHPPSKGAHLLRHSLATEMLRRGATMTEIGEILRHRSPRTTEIYAKVDIKGLRALAMPWPVRGGGR